MIKKILLIYPPLPMEAHYGKGLEKIGAALPPLKLLYLGAVLEKAGFEAKVHDSDLLNSSLISGAMPSLSFICARATFLLNF